MNFTDTFADTREECVKIASHWKITPESVDKAYELTGDWVIVGDALEMMMDSWDSGYLPDVITEDSFLDHVLYEKEHGWRNWPTQETVITPIAITTPIPPELPEEIKQILSEWCEKKEPYRERWYRDPGMAWPAKSVHTRFEYNNIEYNIYPEDIGLDSSSGWDQGLMEYLQPQIKADLEQAGAVNVASFGYLD